MCITFKKVFSCFLQREQTCEAKTRSLYRHNQLFSYPLRGGNGASAYSLSGHLIKRISHPHGDTEIPKYGVIQEFYRLVYGIKLCYLCYEIRLIFYMIFIIPCTDLYKNERMSINAYTAL